MADYVYTVSDVNPDDKWTVCHWLPYPAYKPEKEGKYLICTPSICYPRTPLVEIAIWGKSAECEYYDKTLKKIKAYWYDIDLEWGDHTVDDVYAWMPLPEPMAMEEKNDG
jgi:hypothetical protein